jgi:nitrogen PTS system EIIA component
MTEGNQIKDYLSPRRVAIGVNVSSKKRLLEKVAGLLLEGNPGLDRNTVFQILNERERLGSTGIGDGVALPHGRASGLRQPIAAIITLANGLDFESLDQQPVRLVFGLLVPAEANEQHLQLLAGLASMLGDEDVRRRLLEAGDAEDVLACIRERSRESRSPGT